MTLIALLWAALLWLIVRDAIVYGEPRRPWAPEPRTPAWQMRFRRRLGPILGWQVDTPHRTVFGFTAEPYDDLWPVIPFLVTRWRFNVFALGHVVFGWNRYTKLDRYKRRYPGPRAGKSAWSSRPIEYRRRLFNVTAER